MGTVHVVTCRQSGFELLEMEVDNLQNNIGLR